MVLNNKPQMFTFYFPSNFWYPEVVEAWTPIVERMKLPYTDLTDFMNSQVQSVVFPGANLPLATQQRDNYEVAYQGGEELEYDINKTLSITFKLTESYLSYWVIWSQTDIFLHYKEKYRGRNHSIWMEPVKLGFLLDNGVQLVDFTFKEITPTNIGNLTLSYAATVASYNTFNWDLRFNTFDIK